MDEQASTMTKAVLVVVGAAVLLLLPAQRLFGDHGVEAVLLLGLVTAAAIAWSGLTGRPLPRWGRLGRPAAVPPSIVEDTWRSERWVREAVERGLRAIDEWRWEQSQA